MSKIKVTLNDGAGEASVREVDSGTPLGFFMPSIAADGQPVVAALMNNDVVSLSAPVVVKSVVSPLTLDDAHGWRVYRWSLCFILAKAAHETHPDLEVRVRHSLGQGLFCSVEWREGDDRQAIICAIESRMREIVDADLPIERELLAYEEALDRFRSNGQDDKLYLLAHRNPPVVLLADCGGFYDLLQAPMVHRTGLLKTFALQPYEDGFILRLPTQEAPHGLSAEVGPAPLFTVYKEHIRWGRILGVTTAGELNRKIMAGEIDEFIRVAEALHDKKFADIAAQIDRCPNHPKLILIAGPSSSGKTTSAIRLSTNLRVLGHKPFIISTDDYFVGDERNPRDENGKLDYEHIDAVDIERLNHDLAELLAGREVSMPYFDFKEHRPFERPGKFHLDDDQVIVMEGIHSLNPDLTPGIPREQKFLINVSALTQLAIDRSCRVSTTDNRLLRRMVRDWKFRGRSAVGTLQMWPSVLRGEECWIFPFQGLADATFNSALDYEIGVLKPYASDLLNTVKPSMPEYAEARRLTAMLQNFMPIASSVVPGDSILRECIGGSQLAY